MTSDNSEYYCKTCETFVDLSDDNSKGHVAHNIIPKEWVKTCGNCNKVVEDDWSFCAWCGQGFADW